MEPNSIALGPEVGIANCDRHGPPAGEYSLRTPGAPAALMAPLPTCRTSKLPRANCEIKKGGADRRKKTLPTEGSTAVTRRLVPGEPGTATQLVVRPACGGLVCASRRQPVWSVGHERFTWPPAAWAVIFVARVLVTRSVPSWVRVLVSQAMFAPRVTGVILSKTGRARQSRW